MILAFLYWSSSYSEGTLIIWGYLWGYIFILQFNNLVLTALTNHDSIAGIIHIVKTGNNHLQSCHIKGLDMSKEARMLRAKDMGFITDIQSVIEVGNGQDRGRIVKARSVTGGSGRTGVISGKDTQRDNIRRLGRNSDNDPQIFYHGTADDITGFNLKP